MLFSTEDDEDFDYVPSNSSSAKLSSLFSDDNNTKRPNLKYVAPKQPRDGGPDSADMNSLNNDATSSIKSSSKAASATLAAAKVQVFLFDNGNAQPQGVAMCAVFGNTEDHKYCILIYRSQTDRLAVATVNKQFRFLVQPNYYVNFYDDSRKNWSLHFDGDGYEKIVTQVAICRALSTLKQDSYIDQELLTQDVVMGEGDSLEKGDSAKVTLSVWDVGNDHKIKKVGSIKSGQHIKLNKSSDCWEMSLIGCQRTSHRLIFGPDQEKKCCRFYDVKIDRTKVKGGHLSGQSTPREGTSDCWDNTYEDKDSGPVTSKPSLLTRMAKMGHPLLPPGIVNAIVPTDSESEIEEIRPEKQSSRPRSRASTCSVEELSATPAINQVYSNVRPQIPAKSSNLITNNQPIGSSMSSAHFPSQSMVTDSQQMIRYQSMPWQMQQQQQQQQQQQYATMHPSPNLLSEPVPTSSNDSTLQLIFSENRAQNTDLRIALSKVSDKMDCVLNKVEKLESKEVPKATTLIPYNADTLGVSDPRVLLTQITNIVTENEKLKTKLNEKEEKVLSLSGTLNDLMTKNQTLLEDKAALLISHNEHQQQQQQQHNHQQQHHHQQQQNDNYTTIIKEINEEKIKYLLNISTIEQQLQLSKNEVAKLSTSLLSSNDDIKCLKSAIIDKDKEYSILLVKEKDKLSQLQQHLQLLQNDKLSTQQIIEQSHIDNVSLQAKLSERIQDNVSLKAKISECTEECDKLKYDFININETKQNNQVEELDRLGQKLDNSLSLHSTLKSNNKLLEEEIKRLKIEIDSNKKSSSNISNTTSNISNTTTNDTVKKVMNSVYKMTKRQFDAETNYQGSDVMDILLQVIRNTTLQLIETKKEAEDIKDKEKIQHKNNCYSEDKSLSSPGNVTSSTNNEIPSSCVNGVDVIDMDNNDKGQGNEIDPNDTVNNAARVLLNNKGENNSVVCVNDELSSTDRTPNRIQSPELNNKVSNYILTSNEESINNHLSTSNVTVKQSLQDQTTFNKQDVSSKDNLVCKEEEEEEVEVEEKEVEVEVEVEEKEKVTLAKAPILSSDHGSLLCTPRPSMSKVTTLPTEHSRSSTPERCWRPEAPPPPLPLFSDNDYCDNDSDDDWLS